jgi:chaperonin cofactor prefoldin
MNKGAAMTEYDTLDALKGEKQIRREYLEKKIEYSQSKIDFHQERIDRMRAELEQLIEE